MLFELGAPGGCRRGLRGVDCDGEVVAGSPAASAVHDPQGGAIDGTVGLQDSLSSVRGLDMDEAVWDVKVFAKNASGC